ncbi:MULTISPECIES: NmrA family NAD(P)-binding protein [unclassified Streptomyces]|uniref:NmrA family NAD(P)-binding protein n=1 Tax=unclassified Streptomyces TaxID=2593676 RepID=UPI002E344B37|nr:MULTISPECIES: NmrA family NAD(P)-binding protein [unclassified Streptomyces]
MATILVTTANGDTGRPMVDHLVENGFPVRAMVRTDDERAQRLRYKGARSSSEPSWISARCVPL